MNSFAVVRFVVQMIGLYELLIFAYALMSWFRGLGGILVAVYGFLETVCEPFVGLVRRVLPSSLAGGSGIDLSPMAAMLILIIMQNLVESVFL